MLELVLGAGVVGYVGRLRAGKVRQHIVLRGGLHVDHLGDVKVLDYAVGWQGSSLRWSR